MKLLGMPNPALWGVLAAVTNFIPYVGALAMAAILGLAGPWSTPTARPGVPWSRWSSWASTSSKGT